MDSKSKGHIHWSWGRYDATHPISSVCLQQQSSNRGPGQSVPTHCDTEGVVHSSHGNQTIMRVQSLSPDPWKHWNKELQDLAPNKAYCLFDPFVPISLSYFTGQPDLFSDLASRCQNLLERGMLLFIDPQRWWAKRTHISKISSLAQRKTSHLMQWTNAASTSLTQPYSYSRILMV